MFDRRRLRTLRFIVEPVAPIIGKAAEVHRCHANHQLHVSMRTPIALPEGARYSAGLPTVGA